MAEANKQDFFQKHESKIMLGLVGFALLAIAMVLGFYIVHFKELPIQTAPELWGPFGDYLGGVLNPILAFLAFLILMMSFRLQSKELRETREELKKAGDAQLEQVNFARQQLRLLSTQNFESLFFSLLSLKEKSLKLYEFKPFNAEVLRDGRQRITIPSGHVAVEEYLESYYYSLTKAPNINILEFKEFKLYIYSVCNVLDVIESSPYLDEQEHKERYAEILIFGLTPHELRVIFYYFSISISRQHILSDIEAVYLNKQAELIKKYRVLRNFNIHDTQTLIKILGPFSSISQSENMDKIYEHDMFCYKLLFG